MTSTPEECRRAWSVTVPDEAALAEAARVLAAALPTRAFVTLEGDLGAGKTTFVKAIAAAVGIDPAEVVSPTFGLIHVHDGPRGRIVHADMYRLGSAAELRETGWEDAIAGPGWTFVEWPGRIASALPDERLDIAIRIDSETARTLDFTGRSADYDPLRRAFSRRDRPVPPRSSP